MTDSDSLTQVRQGQEAGRGKGGKEKQSNKRGKAETQSRQAAERVEARVPATRQSESGVSRERSSRDPQLIARIQERAYVLFEAGGRKDGYALEHWLEAERQIMGSDQSDR